MTFPTVLATGTLDLVMVPALSALRHDNVRMGAAYRRATRIVAFVGCPMSAMLAVTSPETVRLVYGHKWLPVVPILVWLSVAGVLQPVHNTIGWLYLSSGKARAMFLWGSVASAVLAAGFAVGLRWGTIGIAASYALVMTFVLTVPALYFAHKAANLDLRATLAPICPMIACVLGSSFAALAAGRVVGSAVDVWWAILVAKIVVGVCAYAGLALWLVRPLPIDRLERWVVSKRGAAR
jgi:O-antigen/teichoic acid export membrane protein